ncbi:MAG: aminodeoxychorismate synthase component I [Desulfurispora sp.]|uniref:aminodeoxychorismate synthase component I n=1 Tax=Desulfurispora sp. TaxID=3014275 RepID=UPI00404ADBAD
MQHDEHGRPAAAWPAVRWRSLDLPSDPVQLFGHLRHFPGSFLLDSSLAVPGFTRWSLMGADPFLVLYSRDDRVYLHWRYTNSPAVCPDLPLNRWFTAAPLDVLKQLLSRYRLPAPPGGLPFAGGAVGCLAYDLGRQFERLPVLARQENSPPDLVLGFYDWALVVDHQEELVYLLASGLPAPPEQAGQRAGQRLDFWQSVLTAGAADRAGEEAPPDRVLQPAGPVAVQADLSREQYVQAVQKIKDYIAAGDVFIVNMTQRFALPQVVPSWQLYRRLRRINPAPMAAYINFPGLEVVCSSPERFLQVRDGRVETRPIKGTRPRGRSPEEDAYWRRELWQSEKDRAELVMIVDLERNDLGRVCRPGSVQVAELYRLEEYATVFHLVSIVRGELEQGRDLVDLLRATFPGGSVTGAPKIRAMEIIEELEPVRRGLYCGSIGYFSFDGQADLNIVIRTLVYQGGQIIFNTGGGVTIDSDPLAEYLETHDKARALLRALGLPEPAGMYELYGR